MPKLSKTTNRKVGYVLGLTGGIATGKSTAAAVFRTHHIPVIDGDTIAREVVEPNSQGLTALAQTFGEGILHKNGTLNRSALAKIIFSSSKQRKKLDQLLDPFIRQAVNKQIQQADAPLIVVDLPLLFERHYEEEMTAVAVVYIPEITQLQRLMKRNQLSLEEAEKRIHSQLSIERKKERADFLFDNTGSVENLTTQIENWLSDFNNRFL
ncbi:dephospho-CoA kinase [Enterococcus ratti]|uniref:dephospho-CoA kinase n=1 Tax=Enterococcus ratti TaxID=150033 RepID=UPI0009003ACA|nr:dephospho-CoA kinase [Enterococcus ratti]